MQAARKLTVEILHDTAQSPKFRMACSSGAPQDRVSSRRWRARVMATAQAWDTREVCHSALSSLALPELRRDYLRLSRARFD